MAMIPIQVMLSIKVTSGYDVCLSDLDFLSGCWPQPSSCPYFSWYGSVVPQLPQPQKKLARYILVGQFVFIASFYFLEVKIVVNERRPKKSLHCCLRQI